MSRKPQSKDEALEALDFIVNVLKEHEKDLDRLISELGTVTEAIGATGELTSKVEKIEERITGLQNEITNLISYLSTNPREPAPATAAAALPKETPKPEIAPTIPVPVQAEQPYAIHGPPVILRCKQWDDFQGLATQAQNISFMVKEAERTFQADALKGNQIITYSGEIPKLAPLLKIWLSKQLEIPERKVLEGVLAIA